MCRGVFPGPRPRRTFRHWTPVQRSVRQAIVPRPFTANCFLRIGQFPTCPVGSIGLGFPIFCLECSAELRLCVPACSILLQPAPHLSRNPSAQSGCSGSFAASLRLLGLPPSPQAQAPVVTPSILGYCSRRAPSSPTTALHKSPLTSRVRACTAVAPPQRCGIAVPRCSTPRPLVSCDHAPPARHRSMPPHHRGSPCQQPCAVNSECCISWGRPGII